MKKFFAPLVAVVALPLFSSCTEYGAYGYTSTGYSSGYGGSVGYSSYPASSSYGYNYAPLQVGFIATSYTRWAYDPYRACYYDRQLGRYYDYHRRSYYTSVPPRYNSPRYPSGYRHGRVLDCPTYLPRSSQSHSYGSGHGHSGRPQDITPYQNPRYNQGTHGYDRSQRTSYPGGGPRGSENRGPDRRQPAVVPSYPTPPSVAPSYPNRPTIPTPQPNRPTRLETVNTRPQVISPSPQTWNDRGGMRQPAPTVQRSPQVRQEARPMVRPTPQIPSVVPSPQPMPSRPEMRQPLPNRAETRQDLPNRPDMGSRGRIR